MIQLINFLRKRPSDTTIRVLKIIFGLLIILAGYYNLIYQGDDINSTIFWQEVSENQKLYIKYIIIGLGIFPLINGVSNFCLLKKKYMKIAQIIFAIVLFYISSIIIEGPDLDFDTLVLLLGFLPLIGGITGKCITTKCLKYKEKIKKIRV